MLWSGDSACGQGNGFFVSWSRRNGTGSCVSNGAIGIHRLSGFTSGTHTYKLVKQADGSVKGYIDGGLVTTVLASGVGCWTSGFAYAFVSTAAWDPGDQQGGSPSNHALTTNFLMNGGERGYLCGTNGIYHCTNDSVSQAQIWTER